MTLGELELLGRQSNIPLTLAQNKRMRLDQALNDITTQIGSSSNDTSMMMSYLSRQEKEERKQRDCSTQLEEEREQRRILFEDERANKQELHELRMQQLLSGSSGQILRTPTVNSYVSPILRSQSPGWPKK